ncbi:predicted protein [Nematostella vectensis]|uniref:Uncharacterized protein n=1 Tax=Nematostella vectensis TaxID=45351 RepID=A7S4J2_NEMVE|nr:predicted protein [Nematostella vectensis]|eukprot:XP_001633401.1 predicted protein [Nematostella vectensis]
MSTVDDVDVFHHLMCLGIAIGALISPTDLSEICDKLNQAKASHTTAYTKPTFSALRDQTQVYQALCALRDQAQMWFKNKRHKLRSQERRDGGFLGTPLSMNSQRLGTTLVFQLCGGMTISTLYTGYGYMSPFGIYNHPYHQMPTSRHVMAGYPNMYKEPNHFFGYSSSAPAFSSHQK